MSKPKLYKTHDEAILGEIVPRISDKMKELGINYVATIRHAEAFYHVDKVADLFIHENKNGFYFRGSERSFQRALSRERLFMAYNPDTTYFPNLMLKNKDNSSSGVESEIAPIITGLIVGAAWFIMIMICYFTGNI